MSIVRPALIVADRWREYQLLDCGDGLKQERWGEFTLVRPDPQIIWPRHGREKDAAMGPRGWENWDGFYHRSESGGGQWEYRRKLPEAWQIRYESLGLTFKIHPTSFKHTGLFPEQAVNWEWFSEKIAAARKAGRAPSVLNLFGYTGAASIAAAKAGAAVCHVDAAEGMVKWCRENAALSGLAEAPGGADAILTVTMPSDATKVVPAASQSQPDCPGLSASLCGVGRRVYAVMSFS